MIEAWRPNKFLKTSLIHSDVYSSSWTIKAAKITKARTVQVNLAHLSILPRNINALSATGQTKIIKWRIRSKVCVHNAKGRISSLNRIFCHTS